MSEFTGITISTRNLFGFDPDTTIVLTRVTADLTTGNDLGFTPAVTLPPGAPEVVTEISQWGDQLASATCAASCRPLTAVILSCSRSLAVNFGQYTKGVDSKPEATESAYEALGDFAGCFCDADALTAGDPCSAECGDDESWASAKEEFSQMCEASTESGAAPKVASLAGLAAVWVLGCAMLGTLVLG